MIRSGIHVGRGHAHQVGRVRITQKESGERITDRCICYRTVEGVDAEPEAIPHVVIESCGMAVIAPNLEGVFSFGERQVVCNLLCTCSGPGTADASAISGLKPRN